VLERDEGGILKKILDVHRSIAQISSNFFRQVHLFGLRILLLFESSDFFHFKVHCWSGVWAKNSRKKIQTFFWVAPNYRITLCQITWSTSLWIGDFMTFWQFGSCFLYSKAQSWNGMRAKNSEKIPDVLRSTPNSGVTFRWITLRRTP